MAHLLELEMQQTLFNLLLCGENTMICQIMRAGNARNKDMPPLLHIRWEL